MAKKAYKGAIKEFKGKEIHLNISQLENGIYELKIMDKNTIIKNTQFIKK
ncbi:MAG: hypothetical protein HRU26_12870 [Psychroserpens sp.]|nr:hypothetical protein [Psychroserpens sp.]